jgi:predicted nuclease with TOPRIM domain
MRQVGNSFQNLNLKRVNSRSSSIRSLHSSISRIKEENEKMVQKIEKTKSHYSKFRDTQYSKRDKKETYREELIKLLENQLGTKPKVVFPNVKSRKRNQSSADDP